MWYVVKVKDGKERRVFSRHRTEATARKAAGKLMVETGLRGISVVHKDKKIPVG